MEQLLKADRKELPDFLVIGAGKSGTTSLDQYLSEHPDIFMSPVKEPNFFAFYTKNVDYFSIKESRDHFKESVTDLTEYLKLFDGSESFKIKGETSNTYLYDEESVTNILNNLPDVKLIVIFRQPAERLYSRYLHLARENLLPTENFEDCLDKNSIWWKRPDLVNEGFYFKHLKRFYENFPKGQIKVYLFEDLRQPEQLFNSLFSFLEVDSNFKPETGTVYNQSGFVKNKFKNNLIGPNGLVIKSVKFFAPWLVKQLKSNQAIKAKLNDTRAANLSKPKLDPELKKRITNEIYLEDIKSLEKLIERDLSKWY